MAYPTFVAVGATNSGGSGSVSAAAPAGVTSSDFQICAVSGATGSETLTAAAPSTWPLLGEIDTSSPAGPTPTPDRGGSASAWVHYSTTAGSASAAFTKSGTRIWQAARAAWTGQTGVGSIGTPLASSATTTHAIPSVTPPANTDCVVIAVAICDALAADAITFSPPSGWTEHYDIRTATGSESEIISIASIQVPGSASPSAVTGSFTTNAVEEVATFSVVLLGTTSDPDVDVDAEAATVSMAAQQPVSQIGVPAQPAWISVLAGAYQLSLQTGPVYNDPVNGAAGIGFEAPDLGPTGKPAYRVERVLGTDGGWGVFIAAKLTGDTIPAGSVVRLSWWARGSDPTTGSELKSNPGSETVLNGGSFAINDVTWTQVSFSATCAIDWVPGTHFLRSIVGGGDTDWMEWSDVVLTVSPTVSSSVPSPTAAIGLVAPGATSKVSPAAECAAFGFVAVQPERAGDLIGREFPCQVFTAVVTARTYSASVSVEARGGELFPVSLDGEVTSVSYDGASSLCGQ